MWWKGGAGPVLLKERDREVRAQRSNGRIDRGQKWSHDRSAGPNLRPLSSSAELFWVGDWGGEGAASDAPDSRRVCPFS